MIIKKAIAAITAASLIVTPISAPVSANVGDSMDRFMDDMGGAANVLGLAHMIMALNLPVRMRVLIPAVENSIDGNAFRPQDILTSRKGLTVEINNTDAEGRLVLADALTLADEDDPALVISMATLTGAARVAVGPDLSPFFTDNDDHAAALSQSAANVADPVWRLPFHDPYEATNRQVHAFNKQLNVAILGEGDSGRDGPYVHPDISNMVINFADNAAGPSSVLNGLLQGDIASAATNAAKIIDFISLSLRNQFGVTTTPQGCWPT